MNTANNNLFKIIGNRLVGDKDSLKMFFFNFYKGFPTTYNYIANNKFISDSKRLILINIFFQIRKIYDRLNSFAKYLKIKYTKDSSVTTDLCLNSLDNYPQHLKINIIQKERSYTFRLSDMMQLWYKSLTKSVTFSPFPEMPRNPYTNIKFKKSVFVNTYLKLKKTNFTVPIILEYFWQSSMDIHTFELDAYTILKEYSINNYINDSCNEILFYDVINMLSSIGEYINYRMIHTDLYDNKALVVKNMKVYLKYFLFSQESCNKFKKRMFKRRTINGLQKFFYKNPTFGRRIVRPMRNNIINTVNNENTILTNNDTNISELSVSDTSPNDDNESEIDDSEIDDNEINDSEIDDNEIHDNEIHDNDINNDNLSISFEESSEEEDDLNDP